MIIKLRAGETCLRLLYTCMFAAAFVCQAADAQAQNLIRDGGFEVPAPPDGSYTDYNPGQVFGRWTVVGNHNVSVTSTTEVNNGVTLDAEQGAAFLDLTGNCDCGDPTSGVAQTVDTVAGTSYTLTFWVGNCYTPGFGTTSTVNVYVGPTLLMAAENTGGQGQTKQVWERFSATFTATRAKTTIRFLNGDPSGDQQNGVDRVSLYAQ